MNVFDAESLRSKMVTLASLSSETMTCRKDLKKDLVNERLFRLQSVRKATYFSLVAGSYNYCINLANHYSSRKTAQVITLRL